MVAAIVAVVVILIPVIWWIGTGNDFTRKDIKITEAQSGIEVALTKRYDMLTKMLDVAKGYKQHETELFAGVIKLRKGMSVKELGQASAQMDNIASSLNLVAEAYPELRSSEVFKELQAGIRDAEEHLQAARRLYNANVTAFNTAIKVFPSSIVAKNKSLTGREFFEADEIKRGDVSMKF
jgi:LemA protein